MTLSDFLEKQLGYPALPALAQLAGQKVARTKFFADVNAAREAIEPWMPISFLPVATDSGGCTLGLHLRPTDVASRRLAFVRAEEPAVFVEVATSVEQLLYLSVLGEELWHRDKPVPDKVVEAAATVNRIVGTELYKTGRYEAGEDEGLVMIRLFGGTPAAISVSVSVADTPAERLVACEKGIALGAHSLEFHANAARVHLEAKNWNKAAEQAAASLACFHHTAHFVEVGAYLEELRPLLKECPKAFDEDAAFAVNEDDPRTWVKRAGELFYAGHVARSEKLLNDVCHGTGGYTSTVPAFRKHYEALGWKWALALCDLRA